MNDGRRDDVEGAVEVRSTPVLYVKRRGAGRTGKRIGRPARGHTMYRRAPVGASA